MSNASLELCKELYELSGWDCDAPYGVEWHRFKNERSKAPSKWEVQNRKFSYSTNDETYPAYDLGYLLRKLQPVTENHGRLFVTTMDKGGWTAGFSATYDRWHSDKGFGDTPEDAACKLAIELFKLEVLKK